MYFLKESRDERAIREVFHLAQDGMAIAGVSVRFLWIGELRALSNLIFLSAYSHQRLFYINLQRIPSRFASSRRIMDHSQMIMHIIRISANADGNVHGHRYCSMIHAGDVLRGLGPAAPHQADFPQHGLGRGTQARPSEVLQSYSQQWPSTCPARSPRMRTQRRGENVRHARQELAIGSSEYE